MNPSKLSTMIESCGKIKDLLYSPDSVNVKLGFEIALSTQNLDFESELLSMIEVQGGTFIMCEKEMPQKVTLNTFCIGKYQVTQCLWEMIMENNPGDLSGEGYAFRPVEKVSWDDVQIFLEKLNAKTGKTYRLPTEAEWEYAAKGGNLSKNYQYAGSNDVNSVAWYKSNSGSKTHLVGQKTPNELSIYDMSGNVWEWCSDWYGGRNSFYQNNPKGASFGTSRVLRGGSWNCDAEGCRSSYCGSHDPDHRFVTIGFRLAL